MTRFYPGRPDAGTPSSELRVWDSLRSLPDDWRAFHSVPWQSVRNGRQGDGEADFILLHPRSGLLVLEVKGGGLELVDGRWYQTNLDTRERTQLRGSPFEQAMKSKHMLLDRLAEVGLEGVPVCHAVAFPRTTIVGALSLEAPRAIVIDATDLTSIERAISRIIRHWDSHASLSEEVVGRLTKLLAPTAKLVRTLRSQVEDVVAEQVELTDRQYDIARGLRRNRRAVILGGAGTGKTLLATAEAERLASEGFKVLLTCYNAPLGAYLRRQASETIEVRTFHSFCQSQLVRAGRDVPSEPDQAWWEQAAPEALIEAATRNDTVFDALVIDEFQDFAEAWLEALTLLLSRPDDAPIYLFADTHQDLYRRTCSLPDWPVYELDLNCRNTEEIGREVGALFGDDVQARSAHGPSPRFVRVTSDENALDLVPTVVQDLIENEHLAPRQIAVLSDSRRVVDELRSRSGASFIFVGLDEEGVVVETIHRMKGLEADVVLLVVSGLDLDGADGRPLMYVGMSRARAMLFVIGGGKLREQLGWGRV